MTPKFDKFLVECHFISLSANTILIWPLCFYFISHINWHGLFTTAGLEYPVRKRLFCLIAVKVLLDPRGLRANLAIIDLNRRTKSEG